MDDNAEMTKLTGTQIADAGLTGWVYLLGRLQTRIPTGDFGAGLSLLNAIGAAAEEMDHHPDLDLRYDHLDVALTSHDVGAVTERDVALAGTITRLAAEAGLQPGAAGLSRLELGLDSPDFAAVAPFWAAALGAEQNSGPDTGLEIVDPSGVLPTATSSARR